MFAYSAYVDNERERKSRRLGFTKCLRTPLNVELFNGQIVKMLDERIESFLQKHLLMNEVKMIQQIVATAAQRKQ